MAAKDLENKRVYSEIGDFLVQHRLDPTPPNYMLVHMLVTQSSLAAVSAVEKATADGFRLTQRAADQIIADIQPGLESSAPGICDEAVQAAAREMEAFARLIDETRTQTQSYGRDLEHSASTLSDMNPSAPVAEIIRFTGEMIARTRATERRLEEATWEARSLREKLESAREEARSDLLTELPNRRAFEAEYGALTGEDHPVSLALCDIDHFKSINDSHGHAVGDRVLRALARTLEEMCRGHMVARLGGEEFVILFKGLGSQDAVEFVERSRAAIAEKRFKVRETDSPLGTVTFSAGVAAVAPGEPMEAALRRADGLMYQAKEGGRNRIEAEDLSSEPALLEHEAG